jgi:hypothetical protein
MSEKKYESFEEFWPFYVREHSNSVNRAFHFAGTSLAVGAVAAAVLLRRPKLALLAPVAGYGAAWIGHFFIQKNRPATFEYPIWSLRADFMMWGKMFAGTMDDEVARALAEEQPVHSEANGAGSVAYPSPATGDDRHSIN